MSGYGYYEEEEEGKGGLLLPLLAGGNTNTGGLITGGGIRSFRQGKRGPTVPSLTWGIKKLAREGTGERLKNTAWWKFMQDAIQEAKKKYLASLKPDELQKYLENKAKQEIQKERREVKKKLVLDYLQKLKGRNRLETSDKIASALKMEGNPNVRVLRAAIKILYPELRQMKEEDLKEEMKKYSVRGYTIPPRERYKYKGTTAIGFEEGKTLKKVGKDVIAARVEQLRPQVEELIKRARREVQPQQEQPQEQIQVQQQPKKKKKETTQE
jgi:hypothetical protein